MEGFFKKVNQKVNLWWCPTPAHPETEITILKDRIFEKPFQKVLILVLFIHEKICCGYSLEVPQWSSSMSAYNITFHGEIRKYIYIWKLYLSGVMWGTRNSKDLNQPANLKSDQGLWGWLTK